jgi:phage tail-like protein
MKLKFCLFSVFILSIAFVSPGVSQTERVKKSESNQDVEIIFQVRWDGKIIPGITKVSGLKRVTEVITHRDGDDPSLERRSPGITSYEPIVLQRPRTGDTEFERWANKVWNFGSGLGVEVSLKDFRKDIRIELCTKSGKILMAFNVYRCWPSEYVSLSELDTDSKELATEKLVLQHDGWVRDYSVQ